eukprot:c10261_g1_i1.p1 GENE.c10261_g1_i1~~c10261_g1_i1.p1  ORF type:complete len:361 (+),score=76.62 c10261_g1_i1:85-1167(+)
MSNEVIAVTIAHADEEEVILMAAGVPPEEISDAIKSLFPTLPGNLKGFRQIQKDRSLGPFIPLSIAVRLPTLLRDGVYQVQVYPAWRREGITYEKNELHLDISEAINVVMVAEDLGNGNSKMTIVDTDVSGTMLVRSRLSGMPGCKLAYETQNLDTVVYHPCVKVDKFEQGVLKFIPPDGQTELARYRVSKHIKLPFRVLPVIRQLDDNRLEIKINLKAAFGKDVVATDISLRVPCPRNTVSYTSKASKGTVTYLNELECLFWKVPKMNGDSDCNLSAEVKMLSGAVEADSNAITTVPPLTLEFNVVGYAASGLRVRYLEIYESGEYEKESWIRYMTSAGSYQIRVSTPNVNSVFYTNPV